MKWLAWGWRVVDGEEKKYIVGELECKAGASTALVFARNLYGHKAVDGVQSALSHEIDLLEVVHKLVFNRHHPRRKPGKKKTLN